MQDNAVEGNILVHSTAGDFNDILSAIAFVLHVHGVMYVIHVHAI